MVQKKMDIFIWGDWVFVHECLKSIDEKLINTHLWAIMHTIQNIKYTCRIVNDSLIYMHKFIMIICIFLLITFDLKKFA